LIKLKVLGEDRRRQKVKGTGQKARGKRRELRVAKDEGGCYCCVVVRIGNVKVTLEFFTFGAKMIELDCFRFWAIAR
jgi:hypothetical protein